jgi:hypothetical protein
VSSSDYGQVTTVVQRLGELASLLNPVKLVTVVAEVISEIAAPPPGDPDALETLADAYRKAARAMTWKDGTTTAAGAVITATARAVDRTPQAFTDAADALTELANSIRGQQRRHGELHQALREAYHDATHVGDLPMPDPTAFDDVVRAANGLIRGCLEVYTASLDAADRAASRFADIGGRARAAVAVAGGIASDDAILLAGAMVSVPGIGDAYDDGILSIAQLGMAGKHRNALSPDDRARFNELLGKAGSDTERAWLLKALAAGHSVNDINGFADMIRGKDASWLGGHLSLIDRGGTGDQQRLGIDVRQYEDTTCGTTSLIVARAEADPLYALSLTDGDFQANFKAERDRVHDGTNVIWPEALGTSPDGMADYLNKHSGQTGTEYDWHLVDDTDHREISSTMREVVTAADQGHPVPVLVGGGVPRHYILVVGRSGGDVLIYEPTSGNTVRVPERDFLGGNLSGSAGFDHVQAVVLPR